ncbi:hypothetical protein M9434_005200 [Picochlorum sp. BPE23]|nr:hypothetical protein M9434_005200 [Picochlorum sp. BPE23]
MSEEYPRKIAQIVAAEMLQSKSIEGVQKSSLEVLEDLLLRYLTELGRQSHKNAEIARRTVCNPTDVMVALSNQGISIEDLQKYRKSAPDVDFAQPVCDFPVPKKVTQGKTFAELNETPPGNIPDFLPAFPDEHAYVETEEYTPVNNTVTEQMKKIIEQKEAATEALVAMADRVAPPVLEKNEELEKTTKTDEDGSAEKKNPFLLPASWEDTTSNTIDALLAVDSRLQDKTKGDDTVHSDGDVQIESSPAAPVAKPVGPKELFAQWSWVGGLTDRNKLAFSGAKAAALYDSGEGEFVQKRQVENLLTQNVTEEREGTAAGAENLDAMDLDDEEI